jgi:hypothetical protein
MRLGAAEAGGKWAALIRVLLSYSGPQPRGRVVAHNFKRPVRERRGGLRGYLYEDCIENLTRVVRTRNRARFCFATRCVAGGLPEATIHPGRQH